MDPDSSERAERARAARPVRLRLAYAYAVTLGVLASYGLLYLLGWLRGSRWRQAAMPRWHRRNALRVRHAITRLQGLFVKVGQLISMLTTFLPAELRDQLAALQDRVAPRPWSEVEARLRGELGGPPELPFAELEREPVARAAPCCCSAPRCCALAAAREPTAEVAARR